MWTKGLQVDMTQSCRCSEEFSPDKQMDHSHDAHHGSDGSEEGPQGVCQDAIRVVDVLVTG